jgi:hypothetical protein
MRLMHSLLRGENLVGVAVTDSDSNKMPINSAKPKTSPPKGLLRGDRSFSEESNKAPPALVGNPAGGLGFSPVGNSSFSNTNSDFLPIDFPSIR